MLILTRWSIGIGACLSMLASSSAAVSAQIGMLPNGVARWAKVNGELAAPAAGDVVDYVLSSDGARVIFRADAVNDDVFELFSAPEDASSPAIRLNDPLSGGRDIGGSTIAFGFGGFDYAAAPGSNRVVYIADQFTDNVDELFSVPADRSSSPVRLSLGTADDVTWFHITSDGQHVIYLAGTIASAAIFRVPTDGSAPATSITPFSPKHSVWVSPNEEMLLYSFADDSALYQVPTDGSVAPILTYQAVPPSGFDLSFLLAPTISDDGTHCVVARGDFDLSSENTEFQRLAVPMDGSATAVQLNQLSGGDDLVYDGDDRVALHDRVAPSTFELITISLDGSQRVVIQPPGWNLDEALLVLSEDGSKVIFGGHMAGQHALFQAAMDGSGAPVQLATGSGPFHAWSVGSTVVCRIAGMDENLFAVPLAGGQAPVLLNPSPFPAPAPWFSSVAIHPGGQHVLFSTSTELYSVPLDASELPELLSAPLGPGGAITHFSGASGGEFVAYRADASQNESFELFGAPLEGGPVVTYNGEFARGPVVGDVTSFVVSSDEQRVLYRADQDSDQVFGLFVRRADGSAQPFSLTTGLPTAQNVFTGMGLSPGGSRAAFLQANSPGATSGWLYSADATQATAPILLDDRTGLLEQPLLLSSTHVIYRHQVSAQFELCSKRLDGVGSVLTLTPASSQLNARELTPDGSEVVYLADQSTPGVIELYHVPVDGSAPPTRLNTPLAGNLDVTAFFIAPGGTHVAFIADAEVDERFELYVVPSDGSGPVVNLNSTLTPGGNVMQCAFTHDGASIVYLADQRVDERDHLFRVPVTGGTVVALPSLGSVSVAPDFLVSADGQVCFRTDVPPSLPPSGGCELFSVAVYGSTAPVKISGELVENGNVSSFALSPDQVRVVYRADQRFNEVHELFAASLSGSSPPSRVNRGLPTNGDVEADFVALSTGVLYRADQEANDVLELFFAQPGRPASLRKLR